MTTLLWIFEHLFVNQNECFFETPPKIERIYSVPCRQWPHYSRSVRPPFLGLIRPLLWTILWTWQEIFYEFHLWIGMSSSPSVSKEQLRHVWWFHEDMFTPPKNPFWRTLPVAVAWRPCAVWASRTKEQPEVKRSKTGFNRHLDRTHAHKSTEHLYAGQLLLL